MVRPGQPLLIFVTVLDIYGMILAIEKVSLKHTLPDQTLPITTSGSGWKYFINLSGLNSPWNLGEEIKVTASKTAEGTKTVTTTIQGVGGQTVDVTLAETSDISIAETDSTKRHNLYFALLVHYDEEKVTRERALPVNNVLEIQYTQAFTKLSGTQQVEFQGWANPGSGKDKAKWRIRKLLYDGTFTENIVWASGTQNFDKIWNDRETYDYS